MSATRVILCAATLILGAYLGYAVEKINGPVVEKKLSGNEYLVKVSRRVGATQGFLLIVPERIQASVVLFAGGHGRLAIDDYGTIHKLGGNFLVRSRDYFAREGMMVAVVDTPSDRRTLHNFRTSLAHALDIKGVIAYLRQKKDVPVWLVGTSRGTVSAANAATRLHEGGPDGIVLTSTVFEPSRRPSVYNTDLNAIDVPVLLAHHKHDGCKVTPYSGTSPFMNSVPNAAKVELITFEGQIGNAGNPCGGKSAHGFLGEERIVVKAIADWIKAN